MRGPAVGSIIVIQIRPDHHRVAVDRHGRAEAAICSAVAGGQLGNLRPPGGEVAGRVAREHVRGPAVGSISVVLIRPDHHRVAVDRHAVAEAVIHSAVARGQLGNLRPVGGEVAGRGSS